MKNFQHHIISPQLSAQEAMQKLEVLPGSKTLFATNSAGKLLGCLTDGDLRRGFIEGRSLKDNVADFMCRDFVYLIKNNFTIADLDRCRSKKVNLLPLLDEKGNLQDVVDLKQQKSLLPVTALIMAGGRGERLSPLTDMLPKPLLKVGTKPVLEYILSQLVSYGIQTVYIAVNYLGEKIKTYFGSGSSFGINIYYLEEDQPLGTIGAAVNLPHTVQEDILIMNGDILSNINLEDFYRTFYHQNADMAVATVPYHINIPYAVLDIQNHKVKSLTEKPTFTYQASAGIYFLKRELLSIIPAGKYYEATDLIRNLTEQNKKVAAYMVLSYWLDIGTPSDYQKAQEDIRYLNL